MPITFGPRLPATAAVCGEDVAIDFERRLFEEAKLDASLQEVLDALHEVTKCA
jgi:hypothetical protein